MGGSDTENSALRPESAPGLREPVHGTKPAAAQHRTERQAPQAAVQVPASPVKRVVNTAKLETSPRRIQLGIDKGKRAADMSLKRVASLRNPQDGRTSQQGGYLRRSKTPIPGQPPPAEAGPRPLTFNERLAAARTEETEQRERQQRMLHLQSMRSKAFDVSQDEMEEYKSKAVDLPNLPAKPQEYTREEITGATSQPKSGHLRRSNTAPSIRSKSRIGAQDTGADSSDISAAASRSRPQKLSPAEIPESEAGTIEPYSGLQLSKRILPHKVLARSISGKKAYLLKDLLKHVKAPDWSLPDVESDTVVFAIIASKSDPRNHAPGRGKDGQQQDRGKYMVITLADLTFEIELFLFNSGFDRFWKLSPGTVVAILNPVIMPPPPGREATGKFGLVINSDADTILEIGHARDIGFCKSVKKDGHLCNSWVNARRTEYCEFHTNEALRRSASERMEFNTVGFGGGPRKRFNSRTVAHHSPNERPSDSKQGSYDRFTMSHYYVSGGGNGRGVGLAEDEREGGLADRAQKEEALKRRMVAREKERDIAKKLSEIGNGAGKEYLAQTATVGPGLGSSISSSSTAVTATSGVASSKDTSLSTTLSDPPKMDAVSLGIIRPRDQRPELDFSRAKRNRPESSQSSSTAGGTLDAKAAWGWGAALGGKLGRMKEGEKLDGSKGTTRAASTESGSISSAFASGNRSPVRKKTRFVTEKGIREAGRESLGEPLSAAAKIRRQVLLDDDDDDDLVIV